MCLGVLVVELEIPTPLQVILQHVAEPWRDKIAFLRIAAALGYRGEGRETVVHTRGSDGGVGMPATARRSLWSAPPGLGEVGQSQPEDALSGVLRCIVFVASMLNQLDRNCGLGLDSGVPAVGG